MASSFDSSPPKQVCRLCYYETADTTDVFSEKGIEFDYEGKITKYLYLHIDAVDDVPKTVCWMCTQHLETFHKFYEKINEIQKNVLKEKYEQIALHPQYITSVIEQEPEQVEYSAVITVDDKNEKVDSMGDDDMVEVLMVSDEYTLKLEGEESAEEYEILEVEPTDFNGATETNQSDANRIEIIGDADQFIEESEVAEDEIEVKKVEKRKSPVVGVRRSLRGSARKDIRNGGEAKTTPARKSSSLRVDDAKSVQKRKVGAKKEANVSLHPNKASRTDSSDVEQCREEADEGESGDEFPARDSDNDDWPAQQTISEFPKEILRDGLLQIKGKHLMSMICKFYLLECDLCEDKPRFKQLNDLLDHYTISHNEKGYVKCCQMKFTRYPAIIMHMARHLQPEAFQCDVCGYTVTRARFLESHKQTHLPDDQKPYICDKCDKRFCWKGALNIHMISHQPVNERRMYVCHLCGKVYNTPGGLSTHKRYIHTDVKKDKSNVCQMCGKNFATRTGLNEHMTTIHRPREQGQVQCTECGKWLMNNRCLRSHMVLHSDEEYKCEQCDYVTKKKQLLNRHTVTKHSSDRPFACDLCGRSFKMKRALTVHLAQHGSTKTFNCPFCDRVFNSSTNFYAHRKSAHPKELAEMRQREEEIRRRKRIKAGVEKVPGDDDTVELIDTNESDMASNDGHEITVVMGCDGNGSTYFVQPATDSS